MNPVCSTLKTSMKVLREEGVGGVRARFSERKRHQFRQIHLFVYGYKSGRGLEPQAKLDLEIKRITLDDNDDIDELTKIDEWKIPRFVTVEKLEEGWLCYAAKHNGRIVASGWTILNDRFEDAVMKRTFSLGPDEVYYWRVYCIPEFRGKGAIPYLLQKTSQDLARNYGKTSVLVLSLTNNKRILNVYKKIGWERIGRAGFIDLLGFRFNYLWGRDAFKETSKRCFMVNMG
jgi:GNAT superfamily N-acetyltransferase